MMLWMPGLIGGWSLDDQIPGRLSITPHLDPIAITGSLSLLCRSAEIELRYPSVSRISLRPFVCVLLVGCISPGPCAAPTEREMVLTEGTTITAYPLPHKQALYPETGDIP